MMRPGPPPSVLVVEDHAINRKLMERVLELEGFEVLSTDSLASAQRIARARVPEVIVLDIHLPDGNGFELADGLSSDPVTAGCAIVVCTAATMSGEERRAHEAGWTYVSKPIDTRRFAALVTSLMTPRTGNGGGARELSGPAHVPADQGAA
jgi:CheY-like chemotaxis protein